MKRNILEQTLFFFRGSLLTSDPNSTLEYEPCIFSTWLHKEKNDMATEKYHRFTCFQSNKNEYIFFKYYEHTEKVDVNLNQIVSFVVFKDNIKTLWYNSNFAAVRFLPIWTLKLSKEIQINSEQLKISVNFLMIIYF